MQRIPEVQQLLTEVLAQLLETEQTALEKGYFPELSLAELRTLTAIGTYSHPKMFEVAELLKITPGTLTVAVRRLKAKGFLESEKDFKDKRIVRLSLTMKGKVAVRLYSKYQRLTAQAILAYLDEQGQDDLIKLLLHLKQFLEKRKQHIAETTYATQAEWRPMLTHGEGANG